MSFYSDENQVRRFLLGESSQADRDQIEDRLLRDANFDDELLRCEDELIDDYARNLLTEHEQELFDKNFANSPERYLKLMMAQAAIKYAQEHGESAVTVSPSVLKPKSLQADPTSNTSEVEWPSPKKELVGNRKPSKEWSVSERPQHQGETPINKRPQPKSQNLIHKRPQPNWVPSMGGTPIELRPQLFAPGLTIAFAALLAVALIGGYWFVSIRQTITQQVTAELNTAYSQQRPIEARITGFNHAKYPALVQLMGDKPEPVKADSMALKRAEHLLFEKKAEPSNPKFLQAMGQFYLAQQKFDEAIKQLREGVRLAPADAKLHADLGAALLGKIESDRQTETGVKKEDVNECFGSLNKALELDANLLEAIFNRALLKQHEKLRREARADWQRYLQLDPNSQWSKEAKANLDQIEEELKKTSRKQEQRMKDFQAAYATRNSEKVLEAVSQSYTFNGNSIFEELLDAFLAANQGGCKSAASERFKAIAYIGDLVNSEKGDRYFSDLAYYYSQAKAEQVALSAQARQLMREANFYYGKSQNDRAVELYQKAENLFLQAGNEAEPLFAKSWIGQCHHQRSDTVQNLKAFNEVLPVCVKKKVSLAGI